MSMTDSIADMLTRIRNGQKAQLLHIALPYSKIKNSILKVLQDEGYIKSFDKVNQDSKPLLQVELKYSANGRPGVREIHRVSRPSKRMYTSKNSLKEYYNGMGIYILSTPIGVLSSRTANKHGVGGEIICKVF